MGIAGVAFLLGVMSQYPILSSMSEKATMPMRAFITRMPKAELHVHLEGTLEAALMRALAQRNRIRLLYPSAEALKDAYRSVDAQSFQDLFFEGMRVLRHEQDFYDLTWAYLLHAHAQHILHTEFFFTPQLHTDRGVALLEALSGIHRAQQAARRQLGLSSGLILCFLRHLSPDAAMHILDEVSPYKDWLLGVGLEADEQLNPPGGFDEVFARARILGLRLVAHAGERGSAEDIRQVLRTLHVERIDNGVSCYEDPALLEQLAQRQTPLTLCPLSNLRLGIVASLAAHRIPDLLKENLCVSVHSDYPAFCNGYLNENLEALQRTHNLSQDDICRLCRNALAATFLRARDKQRQLQALESYMEGSG